MLPVRSYRTLAPLPVRAFFSKDLSIGGMFLWHSPHGRPHWALPSKFDFLGARTFLRDRGTDKAAPTIPATTEPTLEV